MTKFTSEDIQDFLADLRLYAGGIREVTDVSGPVIHPFGELVLTSDLPGG